MSFDKRILKLIKNGTIPPDVAIREFPELYAERNKEIASGIISLINREVVDTTTKSVMTEWVEHHVKSDSWKPTELHLKALDSFLNALHAPSWQRAELLELQEQLKELYELKQ